jgi:hypothetical protein
MAKGKIIFTNQPRVWEFVHNTDDASILSFDKYMNAFIPSHKDMVDGNMDIIYPNTIITLATLGYSVVVSSDMTANKDGNELSVMELVDVAIKHNNGLISAYTIITDPSPDDVVEPDAIYDVIELKDDEEVTANMLKTSSSTILYVMTSETLKNLTENVDVSRTAFNMTDVQLRVAVDEIDTEDLAICVPQMVSSDISTIDSIIQNTLYAGKIDKVYIASTDKEQSPFCDMIAAKASELGLEIFRGGNLIEAVENEDDNPDDEIETVEAEIVE